jgi:hypothetical protein
LILGVHFDLQIQGENGSLNMFKIQLVDFAGISSSFAHKEKMGERGAPTVGPNDFLFGIDISSSFAHKEIEVLKFLESLGEQRKMKSINGVIQVEDILDRG